MTQAQCIAFYRGFLKLVPTILERPPKDQQAVLGNVFLETFQLAPTREHILLAVAAHQGNNVKRKWDLKQQWIVSQFLSNPDIPLLKLQKTLRQLFRQRTRPTVIESCRAAARGFDDAVKRSQFIAQVGEQMRLHSRDGNILTA